MAECLIKRRYNDGGLKIVSWQNGTTQEIAAMLQAHDNGLINIYDYWSVGDERTEHLSAIPANPNGAFTTAMDAQDVVIVLMNEGYMNQQGIHFAIGQKDCLNQKGRMNATNTNTGSWKDSLMRADLNNLYYNAFSADFRALFKPFDVLTAKTYDGSTNETTQDHIALFAEKEIFGTVTWSNTTEATALSQIEYYKIASNKIKKINGSDYSWWERSPNSTSNNEFCRVNVKGAATASRATITQGLAPFGCI